MQGRAAIARTSVFLVSGGARGITAACVVELARRHRCAFILLGRTPLPGAEPDWASGCTGETELKRRIARDLGARGEQVTPQAVQRVYTNLLAGREIRQTLRAIEQSGGRAEYLDVDVTDGAALGSAVAAAEARLGQVTGIIHGAGRLADKRIEKKTAADFDAVYTVKVAGLRALLGCVKLERLEHLVLFSSIAGFSGNTGQTDYAIANEVLNKAAYLLQRRNPHCHVVTINWGPWEGGMVTPEIAKLFEQRGLSLIPQEVGARMLADELERPRGDIQIVIAGPTPLQVQATPGEQREFRIRRMLSLRENPFLEDHRIAGRPVLPLGCAGAWMAGTCERLYPGYVLHRCTDLRVLKGITFEGADGAGSFVLELRETAREEDTALSFEARVSSAGRDGRPVHHYRAGVELRRRLPAPPSYPGLDLSDELGLPGGTFYGDGTLFHGPRFQGVERVLHLRSGRLAMLCRLPAVAPTDSGQFPVQSGNPYIVDVEAQGVLIWLRKLHGKSALPAGCQSFEQFRPIAFGEPFYVSVEPRMQGAHTVVADVMAHDRLGALYNRILGLELTVLEQLPAASTGGSAG